MHCVGYRCADGRVSNANAPLFAVNSSIDIGFLDADSIVARPSSEEVNDIQDDSLARRYAVAPAADPAFGLSVATSHDQVGCGGGEDINQESCPNRTRRDVHDMV